MHPVNPLKGNASPSRRVPPLNWLISYKETSSDSRANWAEISHQLSCKTRTFAYNKTINNWQTGIRTPIKSNNKQAWQPNTMAQPTFESELGWLTIPNDTIHNWDITPHSEWGSQHSISIKIDCNKWSEQSIKYSNFSQLESHLCVILLITETIFTWLLNFFYCTHVHSWLPNITLEAIRMTLVSIVKSLNS